MKSFLATNGSSQLIFYYQEPEPDKETGKFTDDSNVIISEYFRIFSDFPSNLCLVKVQMVLSPV